MEKHIYKYLSSTYFIKKSNAGNDGIYAINDDNFHPFPVYGSKLIKELIILFYLDKLTITKLINSWALTQKPEVNLVWFWEQKESLIPISKRVVAQTVRTELIAIQPMEQPTGTLIRLDFVVSGETSDMTTIFD